MRYVLTAILVLWQFTVPFHTGAPATSGGGPSAPVYVSPGVQTPDCDLSGGTCIITYTNVVNHLIVFWGYSPDSNISLAATDSHGDSFANCGLTDNATTGAMSELFYVVPTVASTTFTMTAGGSNGSTRAILHEYSGTGLGIDKCAVGGTPMNTTAYASNPTATTTQANDAIVSFSFCNCAGGTLTQGGGFTSRITIATGGPYLASEDESVSSTGAYTGTFTASIASYGTVDAAAFK